LRYDSLASATIHLELSQPLGHAFSADALAVMGLPEDGAAWQHLGAHLLRIAYRCANGASVLSPSTGSGQRHLWRHF
jgi:hypothetical protein